MAMTAEQILQGKKNMPTKKPNPALYGALKSQAPSAPAAPQATTQPANTSFTPNQTAPKLNQGQLDYFNKSHGGIDKYATDQNARYATGDAEMKKKVLADALRVGYSVKGTPSTAQAAQTTPKTYSGMDYATALSQSNQQVDPLYARAAENVRAEQYQNSLNAGELASARGGAQSGLAADLQNKVSIAAQGNIKDLDAQRAAQTAEMAQALVNRSEDNAFRNRGQDFNEWLGTEQLGLSKDQLNWGKAMDEAGLTGTYKGQKTAQQAQQEWNNRFNYGNAIGQFGNGQQTLENKQFQYTQGRDKVADQRWETEFNRIKEQDGIQNALAWANQSLNAAEFEDSSAQGWAGLDFDMQQAQAGGDQQSAESMRTYFDSMIQRGDDGKITNSDSLESSILNSELSDYDMYQLYQRYGLSWGGPTPTKPGN